MTLGLFLLRAFQMGLCLDDLDALEAGTVYDMMIESENDKCNYRTVATQEDFDRF
jgi:hypothetical protein